MAGPYIASLLALTAAVQSAAVPDVSATLQSILANTQNSDLYNYPTDLTRGIIPKPFHSHNDYWREVPFYSALSYGAVSVEADVWLVDGVLHVGHERSALTDTRTLDSLYIQPILDTLRRQNPRTHFAPEPTFHGVYDADSDQTLLLFIDLKTDGEETWPAVISALKPLLDAGYLTHYDGTDLIERPVTVVGTGKTPLRAVRAVPGSPEAPRYAFYDASLKELNGTQSDITAFDSPVASTDFSGQIGPVRGVDAPLNDTQVERLRSQVAVAHERGILARYWDTPGFPIGTRNAVWRALFDAEVDLLNVDDLKGASEFWQNQG